MEAAYRKELLLAVKERREALHYGAELQGSAVEKVEQLVRKGVARAGLDEG